MDDPRNSIDKLERKLYSRKNPLEWQDDRSAMPQGEFDVNTNWKDDDDIRDLIRREHEVEENKKGQLFKKILFGSIGFFVIAIGVAAFMFFGGGNMVSSKNIDIQVVGPSIISAGEELSLDVVIINGNRATLEGVGLLVEYPEGTRVAGDITKELTRQRETVGTVSARGEGRKTVKSVIFGEKESIKEIKITLEYRIQGSSATFFKEKIYEVAIKSSPIIVTISNPEEINSNQEVEFVVEVASNSSELLKNIVLNVEYPFGFTFKSAEPQASVDNNIWRIGDLPSTERRTIRIRGVLEGQNDEERTFRFATGISDAENQDELGAIFSTLSKSIRIRRPFIGLDIALGSSRLNSVISKPGEKIQSNIVISNNLRSELLNTKIEVKFSGIAFDRNSVTAANGGFFRSTDNTIIWDQSSNTGLLGIDPGENEVVSFTFGSLPSFGAGSGSQEVGVSITVSGSQINDGGKPETVVNTASRTVKLASSANVSAKVVRSIGPFENMGPIPPKAENETTYTIVWSLTNSLNTVSQTQVRTQLPLYVSWAGLTNSESENISYNETTREVVWNAGDLQSGTGFSGNPREAYFQVKFEPSLTQVGNTPLITGTITLSGQDRFTNSAVSASAPALSTRFSSDPTFRAGDDAVAK